MKFVSATLNIACLMNLALIGVQPWVCLPNLPGHRAVFRYRSTSWIGHHQAWLNTVSSRERNNNPGLVNDWPTLHLRHYLFLFHEYWLCPRPKMAPYSLPSVLHLKSLWTLYKVVHHTGNRVPFGAQTVSVSSARAKPKRQGQYKCDCIHLPSSTWLHYGIWNSHADKR